MEEINASMRHIAMQNELGYLLPIFCKFATFIMQGHYCLDGAKDQQCARYEEILVIEEPK